MGWLGLSCELVLVVTRVDNLSLGEPVLNSQSPQRSEILPAPCMTDGRETDNAINAIVVGPGSLVFRFRISPNK